SIAKDKRQVGLPARLCVPMSARVTFLESRILLLLGPVALLAIVWGSNASTASPLPVNYTDLPRGDSHFEGYLPQNASVWFRLDGNNTDMWNYTADSWGATGEIAWYFTDANETEMWQASYSFVGGVNGAHIQMRQVFYNGTAYYVQFRISSIATNASDGVNYVLDFAIAAARPLSPGQTGYADVALDAD